VDLGSQVRVRATLVGLLGFALSDKQERDRSADEDGHTANDAADYGSDRGFAFLAVGVLTLYQIRFV
jgi:hypothetical protein